MPDLDRYDEPENGDLCLTRRFLEPALPSHSVTLAGFNVYVGLCVRGNWQHCRFSVAPAHVQEEAYGFMRQLEEYAPAQLPGLLVIETHRNNRWKVTAVIEDGDVLDPDSAETHRIVERYKEALRVPLPPPNVLPPQNVVA